MTELRHLIRLAVLQIVSIVAVFIAVAYLVGRDIDIFGAIALAASVVLIFQVGIRVHEPALRRIPIDDVKAVGKPFGRYQALREILRWGQMSTDHFRDAVRPAITGLVDDRLIRHHGIDRSVHPDRAREMLDPTIWALISAEDGSNAMSTSALSEVVTRIEEM